MASQCHALKPGFLAGGISTDERTLIDRCLGGDAAAWETMVASHGPRIRSLVLRYPQLHAEAEDVKQEVFLRVFCHLRTFRTQNGSLGNWVFSIGRNFIFDRPATETSKHALRTNYLKVVQPGAWRRPEYPLLREMF